VSSVTAPNPSASKSDSPETVEPQAPQTAGEPADEPQQTAQTDEREDELPEWARKRLTKANTEAANYRTRLREAEAQLHDAKPTEEFEKALADVKARNVELEQEITRVQVARKFNLPDDLAARLRGTTAEELETDAQALQKYVVVLGPGRLSGGLDPSDDDEVFDPVKEARRARAARR
jgi:hypothetical protein